MTSEGLFRAPFRTRQRPPRRTTAGPAICLCLAASLKLPWRASPSTVAMIRFVFRALGFLLVAAAFAALVVDGTRSIAAHEFLQFSFGDAAAWLAAARFTALQQGIDHWPGLSQQLLHGLFAAPCWAVTGGLGLLLLGLGRPPAPLIGFSSR
jgi:hypothetical protein